MEKLRGILVEMIHSALAWEEDNSEPCDKNVVDSNTAGVYNASRQDGGEEQ